MFETSEIEMSGNDRLLKMGTGAMVRKPPKERLSQERRWNCRVIIRRDRHRFKNHGTERRRSLVEKFGLKISVKIHITYRFRAKFTDFGQNVSIKEH